ncbi:beta-galactosidase [bacterium]|nr:beta-galactosidase [bacterium]
MKNGKWCLISALCVFAASYLMGTSIAQTGNNNGPVVTIASFKGVPTVFVDGVPHSGMTYMTYNPQERFFNDFGKAGVNFVSFFTTANQIPGVPKPVWVSRDSFDFSEMDTIMNFIYRANHDALIFPRVYLFSPPWWNDEHPDELMRYHDGTTVKPIRRNPGGTALPSWASEIWREDTAYCLRRMIEHIKSQPYGHRVVGYHLASGGTDEWYYYPNYEWFFSNKVMDNFLDYSIPQTKAFRKWLKEKYGTDAALRAAWHNKTVTLETAEIASKRDKLNTDLHVFYDPAHSQNVIDTYEFEAFIVADTIEYFCRVVKEATDGQAFTGAFYGYVTGAVDKVYIATHHLLQSPYIDFITSPSAYQFREAGSGYSTNRGCLTSVALHGKLWWDENDYRTYLTPGKSEIEGWSPDLHSTEMLQLRQLANQITNASAGWWFDMGGGWFDSPEAMAMIKKLNDIAERSVQCDRTSVSEIAVVVDEKSLADIELGGNLYRPLIMDQRLPVGRIGAPADWILLDDLAAAPSYKMYVFLNAFRVTEEQKRAIRQLPSRGAKAIVWVYAPGLVNSTLDASGSIELTGLNLKLLPDRGPLFVEVNDEGAAFLPGVREKLMYGTPNRVGPFVIGDDSSADVLGTMYGTDAPGLIMKTIDNVEVYFSSAPLLPESLLRGIAVRAGVHLYSFNDDILYVNASFIGIHTPRSGKRTLRLPRKTDLYDVYNDRVVAEQATTVTLDLPARQTALFFMGSEKEWRSLGH